MDKEFKKILIAIDDSDLSVKAVETGFSIAHSLKAAVAIVYVVDQTKEVVNADLGITAEQSEMKLLGVAENIMEKYIKRYDGIDEVFRFTPLGLPEEEILNVAGQWGAELIVMGTHARTAIGRMLSGSKAEYVVRHAKVPVLLTPPGME